MEKKCSGTGFEVLEFSLRGLHHPKSYHTALSLYMYIFTSSVTTITQLHMCYNYISYNARAWHWPTGGVATPTQYNWWTEMNTLSFWILTTAIPLYSTNYTDCCGVRWNQTWDDRHWPGALYWGGMLECTLHLGLNTNACITTTP